MAFGRGKVILLGEHSVVHGQPALAAGIGRGVRAAASAAAADRLRVEPWGLSLSPDDEHPLAEAFRRVLARFDRAGHHEITADVDLPSAAGLGCSAALGVAVIGALDDALGIERSPTERGTLALEWERVFHGNPSGVDNQMAACGGIAIYRRGQPLEPLTLPHSIWLVLANSGEQSSTKSMVDGVARLHDRSPKNVGKTFEAIGVLVEQAAEGLATNRLERVGQLMNLNQTLLASLLVSTPRLEELCDVARGAGALGAKLTGAGGGGCIVALAADGPSAETIGAALSAAGADSFTAEVSSGEAA